MLFLHRGRYREHLFAKCVFLYKNWLTACEIRAPAQLHRLIRIQRVSYPLGHDSFNLVFYSPDKDIHLFWVYRGEAPSLSRIAVVVSCKQYRFNLCPNIT